MLVVQHITTGLIIDRHIYPHILITIRIITHEFIETVFIASTAMIIIIIGIIQIADDMIAEFTQIHSLADPDIDTTALKA